MDTTNGLLFLDARIKELVDGVSLLQRNLDKQEWSAMDSNLHYIAAKAATALNKLNTMRQAWIDEMDTAN